MPVTQHLSPYYGERWVEYRANIYFYLVIFFTLMQRGESAASVCRCFFFLSVPASASQGEKKPNTQHMEMQTGVSLQLNAITEVVCLGGNCRY